MIVLSGADLVLADRVLAPGTLVIDGNRICEVRAGAASGSDPRAPLVALRHHSIVPGFIDAHVHGVDGFDTLDEGNPVAAIAARLPRYGVTAFCPTTVACAPGDLHRVLEQVRLARAAPPPRSARVLPAHLESNFINPEFHGAQPSSCLRSPRAALAGRGLRRHDEFDAADLLAEIEGAPADVAIVTLAPELDGGLELIRWLTSRGHRVSLGHSAATYEEALAAVAAGARQATHLFNRMPPLGHRAPGLAGAVLQSEDVAAEVIADGYHVHPALVRMAVAAKGASRVLGITDATSVAGLPPSSSASLGGQPITAGESAAYLRDGTLAGGIATMDRVFQNLVRAMGLSFVDAATVCATTPAREIGLAGAGVLARDAVADFVVLDEQLSVVQTYIGGQLAYSRQNARSPIDRGDR